MHNIVETVESALAENANARELLTQLALALRADAMDGETPSYDVGSFLDAAEAIESTLVG